MIIPFEVNEEDHTLELHALSNRKFKAAWNALIMGRDYDPTSFIKAIDGQTYNDDMDLAVVSAATFVAIAAVADMIGQGQKK